METQSAIMFKCTVYEINRSFKARLSLMFFGHSLVMDYICARTIYISVLVVHKALYLFICYNLEKKTQKTE